MNIDSGALPILPGRSAPMRLWPAALILAGSLAGCAPPPGATATCTDLISTGGGLLKFCQAGDKVRVTESGVDPAEAATEVKIVDDPTVLHALQRQISPRPDFQASRELIAHACVVKGKDYVSIAAVDLRRIVSVRDVDSADDEAPRIP